jgi:hypothetical protein
LVARVARIAGCLVFGNAPCQQPARFFGRWVGESHCVGSHPACHDEDVVYQIDSTAHGLSVQGGRVAGSDTVAMGTLTCAFAENQREFTCAIPSGTWRFAVVRGHLEGSLRLSDSTVMRRVVAYRAQPN